MAQNALGSLLLQGVFRGADPDLRTPEACDTLAVYYFSLAATHGLVEAYYNLAKCYEANRGGLQFRSHSSSSSVASPEDTLLGSMALECYQLAALQGHGQSLHALAYHALKEGRLTQGSELLVHAASAGVPASRESCHLLGRLYAAEATSKHVSGSKLTPAERARLSTFYHVRAAEQGHVVSMLLAAHAFYSGFGTHRSAEEAIKYYELCCAATAGSESELAAAGEASNSLGLLYEEGIGVKQSIFKALTYFKLGLDQSHADATANYGRLLFSDPFQSIARESSRGHPVPSQRAKQDSDPAKALVYLRKAVGMGSEVAEQWMLTHSRYWAPGSS